MAGIHSNYRRQAAIKRVRKNAQAFLLEGNRRLEAGEFLRAEAFFRDALEIVPDFAAAHANLGLVLDRQGDAESAEVCYRRAIEIAPANAKTHLNLGAFLAERKRFDEAAAAYKLAIELRPDSPAGWSNLGVLYACMKREAEAEACYRTAIAIDAAYMTARFNLSYLLLRQGRFEEGWHCLEARDWYAALATRLSCPRWQGEPLAGKSILIGYEAGHGDMIQFCRYVTLLKAQGATSVAMICHPALKTLFAAMDGLDTVIAFDEQIPATNWDYWSPPLSVPYYCNTSIDSIPASLPYLQPPPDRIPKWSSLLPRNGLRVGLVWKGSSSFENDADRSLPSLDVLAPLWSVDGVSFISLQKGAGEAEAMRPPNGLPLVHLGSQLEDFADTAAVVTNLDLVICVDTAVAHLSGALGKPCWVMLPSYKADWRWLIDRTDSPWYPGVMRLFRQSTMGDWSAVVAEMTAALAQIVRDGA